MTLNSEALEPCPFCGVGDEMVIRTSEDLVQDEPPGFYTICSAATGHHGCGASTGWCETKAEAIAAWNRRPALPSGDELDVVAWRWPEPQTEGGFLHSVTNVEPPCSGWQGLVRQSDANTRIQSLMAEVERLEGELKAIARIISENIKDSGSETNRLNVGGRFYTGPAVDATFRILRGIERIALNALGRTGE